VVARIDIAVGIGVGFGGDALLVVLGNGRRGIRFRLGKELRVLLRNLDGLHISSCLDPKLLEKLAVESLLSIWHQAELHSHARLELIALVQVWDWFRNVHLSFLGWTLKWVLALFDLVRSQILAFSVAGLLNVQHRGLRKTLGCF
jgi:hypothetical protein